ncbi:MAG: tRNA-specific adenosine deaminase [Oligoflexia bacterium]|nr:MAG: tRNA-specific adenosine deaminase [Oligoflexia bacterium]
MDPKFMQRAIALSRENMRKNSGGPFGAVVVLNGKIIGEGWNKVTSANDPTAHAEVEAIRQACKNINSFQLTNAEIYTSCEPCPMCLAAIYWARIEKIYYANTRKDAAQIEFDDDFLYQELPKPIEKRKLPMKQVLHEEALSVFKEWTEKADRITY